MSERSGFFDAQLTENGSYDRAYQALDFAKLFSLFFRNGVFISPISNLQVIAKDGLTVTIKAGQAFIDGYWYELTEDMDITLSPNETAYESLCVIACQLNKAERKISLVKKEGVSSSLPVNNGTVHELVLAQVAVGVGSATVSDSNITDLREDSTYCGFVKGTVDEIDTTDLFRQFNTQFNEWFDGVKGILDEDTAGNLLGKITELQTQVNNLPVIYSGVSDPDNSIGKDGDIYIKIIE